MTNLLLNNLLDRTQNLVVNAYGSDIRRMNCYAKHPILKKRNPVLHNQTSIKWIALAAKQARQAGFRDEADWMDSQILAIAELQECLSDGI